MSLRTDLMSLPTACWQNELVIIRPITTEADLIYATLDCRLTDEQKELVNPAWFSVGRAYLSPDDHYPCLICTRENRPIGFINFSKWLGAGDAYSWSYFIDSHNQGKGYGKSAAELAVHLLKSASPHKPIKLATEAVNTKAQALYRSLGFQQLPETDGDDLVFGL